MIEYDTSEGTIAERKHARMISSVEKQENARGKMRWETEQKGG